MSARNLYLFPFLITLILSSASLIYMEYMRSLRDKDDRADRLQLKLTVAQKSAEDSRLSLDKSVIDLQRAKDELARLQQSMNVTPFQFSAAQTKVWAAQMKFDTAQLDELGRKQDAGEALTSLNSIATPP